MTTNSWAFKVSANNKTDLETWIKDEVLDCKLSKKEDCVIIKFSNINDAFRFRMRFDNQCLN